MKTSTPEVKLRRLKRKGRSRKSVGMGKMYTAKDPDDNLSFHIMSYVNTQILSGKQRHKTQRIVLESITENNST